MLRRPSHGPRSRLLSSIYNLLPRLPLVRLAKPNIILARWARGRAFESEIGLRREFLVWVNNLTTIHLYAGHYLPLIIPSPGILANVPIDLDIPKLAISEISS